ncbi:MAG: hypothetical protein H7145_18955 [Akkermansiaceae bacterium]|nr:hypothetical protein [Armatimonadota bacterium]
MLATDGILKRPMYDEPSRSLSLPELLMISIVALLFVGGAVLVSRGGTSPRDNVRRSIPGALTRIETAKALYAAENRLPPDTWLTLSELQKKGYLSAAAHFPTDIHFVPGKVGENATYHFADGAHADHPKPPR